MRKVIFCVTTFVCVLSCFAQTTNNTPVVPGQPLVGAPFDEIIVESNLNVRKKPEPARRKTRSLTWDLINPEHIRQKRQLRRISHYRQYNLDRFKPLNIPSNSVSNSKSNSQSLTFGRADLGSFQSALGLSNNLTYKLPKRQRINLAVTNSFPSNGNGRKIQGK